MRRAFRMAPPGHNSPCLAHRFATPPCHLPPLECHGGPAFPKPGPERWGPLYSLYERGCMRFHGRLSRSITAGLCGTSQRWVVGAACGVGILLVTAPKPVQAIDCQKAATNVERAICRDTGIYALDKELTQALHRVIESHPNERDSMLIDERHWIAKRDASCNPLGDDVSKMHDCLEGAYREQLDVVRRKDSALPAGSSTGSRVAAC